MKTDKTIYCKGKFRKCWIDNGYYKFRLNGKTVYLHRYLYEAYHRCSILPGIHVHHKDENKLNNDLFNLELITQSEHSRLHNLGNKYGRANTGNKNAFKGGSVSWYKRDEKWRARVFINTKEKHLGCFHTEQEAREVLANYYKEEN